MDVLWTKRSEGLLGAAPASVPENHSFALLVLCHGGAELLSQLSALLGDKASGVAVIGTSADLPELMTMAAQRASRGDA